MTTFDATTPYLFREDLYLNNTSDFNAVAELRGPVVMDIPGGLTYIQESTIGTFDLAVQLESTFMSDITVKSPLISNTTNLLISGNDTSIDNNIFLINTATDFNNTLTINKDVVLGQEIDIIGNNTLTFSSDLTVANNLDLNITDITTSDILDMTGQTMFNEETNTSNILLSKTEASLEENNVFNGDTIIKNLKVRTVSPSSVSSGLPSILFKNPIIAEVTNSSRALSPVEVRHGAVRISNMSANSTVSMPTGIAFENGTLDVSGFYIYFINETEHTVFLSGDVGFLVLGNNEITPLTTVSGFVYKNTVNDYVLYPVTASCLDYDNLMVDNDAIVGLDFDNLNILETDSLLVTEDATSFVSGTVNVDCNIDNTLTVSGDSQLGNNVTLASIDVRGLRLDNSSLVAEGNPMILESALFSVSNTARTITGPEIRSGKIEKNNNVSSIWSLPSAANIDSAYTTPIPNGKGFILTIVNNKTGSLIEMADGNAGVHWIGRVYIYNDTVVEVLVEKKAGEYYFYPLSIS